MSKQLRIIDNLKIIEEHDDVAMSGHLICDCGCKSFEIFHTGKKTRGIFSAYLVKKDKQIVIKTVCNQCGKSFVIYDSKTDGLYPLITEEYLEQKFRLKNDDETYEIVMMYNYYPKDFKTNQFYDLFIKIQNSEIKKFRPLYEGV